MGIAVRADEAISLLHQYTSPFYGHKGNDGVKPVKVQPVWERWLNNNWTLRITNYKLDQHFKAIATYYFMGASAVLGCGDYTLFMVDIDVMKSKGLGTPEGALAFARHLRQTLLPGMFFEVSTGGKGIQGFCLLHRRGLSDEEVNDCLRHIQHRLRQEQTKVNADIELVEIKGSVPIIEKVTRLRPIRTYHAYGNVTTWDRQVDDYKVVKSGSFAKFPRTVRDRLEDFKGTTIVSAETLKLPAWQLNKALRTVAVGGSTFVLPHDYEEKLACYERLVQAQGLANLPTKSRAKVTARDFAIFLLLGSVMKYDPKKGMPVKRWERLWTTLHQEGVLDRGFDCHRLKVMRDTISERGLIEWFDERYTPPVGQKGQCCRWQFSEELLDVLDASEATAGHTHNIVGTLTLGEIRFAGPHPVRYPRAIFQYRSELLPDYEQRLELCFAAQAA